MTATYRLKINELDTNFVHRLQDEHQNAELEIKIISEDAALDETAFWEIIDLLDWNKGTDNEAIIAPAVHALSEKSDAALHAFDDILAEKLYQLDGKNYAENMGEFAYPDNFSADIFLYARCCVVANGRHFYEKVLADPTLMPKNFTFETLLYLTEKAYFLKTGKKDYDYAPTINYETFGNREGWEGISVFDF